MSVWFKYAGDKDITPGHPGGASLFKLPVSASFPEYGTILSTISGTEYPVNEGGASVNISGTDYATQTCNVYVRANGSGGSFYDWPNAFDIAYKGNGNLIVSLTTTSYVEISSAYYPNGSTVTDYFHDGAGGYTSSGSTTYTGYGELITSDTNPGSNSISTPVGSFAYESWTGNEYYHDGDGYYYSTQTGYTAESDGAFIGSDTTGGTNQTEVPSGSGNYFTYYSWSSIDYYFQLSGYGYTSSYQGVTSASYGDFITYDGFYNYYWDGSGGYYY